LPKLDSMDRRLKTLEGDNGKPFTLVMADDFTMSEFRRLAADCGCNTNNTGLVVLLDSVHRGYLGKVEYDPNDITLFTEQLNRNRHETNLFNETIAARTGINAGIG